MASEQQEYEILVKYDNEYSSIFIDHHPCDVEGWKGDYFPFAFNIADWNVIMSDSLHLPPSMPARPLKLDPAIQFRPAVQDGPRSH